MSRPPSPRYPAKPPSKKRKLYSPSPSPPTRSPALANASALPTSKSSDHAAAASSSGTGGRDRRSSQLSRSGPSVASMSSAPHAPDAASHIADSDPSGIPNTHIVAQDLPSAAPHATPRHAAPSVPLSPIPPAIFYNQPAAWIVKGAAKTLKARQIMFFQMLATIMYARLSPREAAHYATWTLLALEYLTDAEILVDDQKLVVSTICPQLPLISLKDEEDTSDALDDELVDDEDPESDEEGTGSDEEDASDEEDTGSDKDEEDSNSGEQGTDSDDESTDESHRSEGPADDRTAASQEQSRDDGPPKGRKAADEISYRAGSLRIPDFSQVSHVFDLAKATEDIFALLDNISFDTSKFLNTAEGQVPYLSAQVTLLVEIKPEEDSDRINELTRTQYEKQLDSQAAHFFRSGVKENVIGAVLGLGKRYTYREIDRKAVSRGYGDSDEYLPPAVNVQTQPMHQRNASTPRQKALRDKFDNGRFFLDVHTNEGRWFLGLINTRAQELFPRLWGRVADLKP